jgi:hypothetical protein
MACATASAGCGGGSSQAPDNGALRPPSSPVTAPAQVAQVRGATLRLRDLPTGEQPRLPWLEGNTLVDGDHRVRLAMGDSQWRDHLSPYGSGALVETWDARALRDVLERYDGSGTHVARYRHAAGLSWSPANDEVA